jgi:hypothetical protein
MQAVNGLQVEKRNAGRINYPAPPLPGGVVYYAASLSAKRQVKQAVGTTLPTDEVTE